MPTDLVDVCCCIAQMNRFAGTFGLTRFGFSFSLRSELTLLSRILEHSLSIVSWKMLHDLYFI
jgi:hypothetical protein